MDDDKNSVNDILSEEQKTAQPVQAIDTEKLKTEAESQKVSSKQESAYYDQQVRPGQVIGYGVPTDQKVTIEIVKPSKAPSKKFWRGVLVLFIVLGALVLLGAFGLLAKNIAGN